MDSTINQTSYTSHFISNGLDNKWGERLIVFLGITIAFDRALTSSQLKTIWYLRLLSWSLHKLLEKSNSKFGASAEEPSVWPTDVGVLQGSILGRFSVPACYQWHVNTVENIKKFSLLIFLQTLLEGFTDPPRTRPLITNEYEESPLIN